MGEMSTVNTITCISSLKHLMVLLKCNSFSGLHLYIISQTLGACTCRAMQLRFIKAVYIVKPFSTRPHQNVVWDNNSRLGFQKILNYVPKESEQFSAKN